jgi:hypothetical protein
LQEQIRAEGEALDAARKRVLNSHTDLTLTGLYNVLGAVREGRPLSDEERDVHDRGLVSLLLQHYDTIDARVADAYGWPAGLTDEEILARLVVLNRERAAEEGKGNIRWLRPELPMPREAVAVLKTLDLGETATPSAVPILIPWPRALPEQVTAVAKVLVSAQGPLSARDVARAFKGKRAGTVEPVLAALAAIGQARCLADGRYAA